MSTNDENTTKVTLVIQAKEYLLSNIGDMMASQCNVVRDFEKCFTSFCLPCSQRSIIGVLRSFLRQLSEDQSASLKVDANGVLLVALSLQQSCMTLHAA